MAKRFSLLVVIALTVLLTSCDLFRSGENGTKTFAKAPELILTGGSNAILYQWEPSHPAADSYDLYYREGSFLGSNSIKEGTKIAKASYGSILSGLNNGVVYSVLLVANKSGYESVNSEAVQIRPGNNAMSVPSLTLTAGDRTLRYTWFNTNSAADSYDVYWRQGTYDSAAQVKAGTKITGASSGGSISGLSNGSTYSVIVTANKSGYNSVDSAVRQAVVNPPPLASVALFLTSGDGAITYTWTSSNPEADAYDLYWRQGTFINAADVKAGTTITNAESGGTITDLSNGTDYSVIVTAHKDGYTSADSAIRTKSPGATPHKNPKRGVGYGFDDNASRAFDMQILSDGVSWFYNWATTPNKPNLEEIAAANDVMFVPMTWNANYNVNAVGEFLSRHPEIEYILAYNEPMFPNEANMTPRAAAADWPRLKQLAAEFNLKIISPALNFGSLRDEEGNNVGGPKVWFQAFLDQPEVNLSDMHAIALHCYMDWPSAAKWYCVEEFAEFGLPVWVTEFCAWERIPDEEWQEKYMSEMIIYFEQHPMVEKYAWFIPRAGWAGADNTNAPYHHLLMGSGANTELTRLGQIYLNMSNCDKSIWNSPGQIIKAALFSANHFADVVLSNGWPNVGTIDNTGSSVHFRPTTDSGGQVLDIYNFTQNKWVEYQVNLPGAKNYTLTLRYQAITAANVSVTVDEGTPVTAPLNSSDWTSTAVDLGNISAGNHTIRLRVTAGNCALNWLKVE